MISLHGEMKKVANLTELRISWPATRRNLFPGSARISHLDASHGVNLGEGTYNVVELFAIHEPSPLHRRLELTPLRHRKRPPRQHRRLQEDSLPPIRSRALRHAPVIAPCPWGRLCALAVASWFGRSKGLAEEGVPVDDAAGEVAEVDVVEGVRLKGPFLGAVFELTKL